jgi:hypothetical protein
VKKMEGRAVEDLIQLLLDRKKHKENQKVCGT